MHSKRTAIAVLLVTLFSISSLFARGIDADDILKDLAFQDSVGITAVLPDSMPAGLRQAVKDQSSWSGSALITVNQNGTPAVAFYDMKSVPGSNEVLYISDKVDRTTFDNLRKREDALQVNLVYMDGTLKLDSPRILLEYVDDRDDIRRYDRRTGGQYLYLEVEHMYYNLGGDMRHMPHHTR